MAVKLRDPMEMINRRRRQIHVHSVIYYHFDTNLIPDHTYDAWCVELAALQKAYPKSKHEGYKPQIFADWTGETGFHLPIHDDTLGLAQRLVAYANNTGHVVGPSQLSSASEWQNDVAYKK
jgi:NAD-dependent DNA ligase